MGTILLTFDVEEFDLIRKYNINLEKSEYELSYQGLKEILKLLNKYRIKSTFFITASFAQKYPKLIKNISKEHEIGLHGLKHDDDYDSFPEKESYKRLKKAKQIIEKIINKKIFGFRAPRFFPPKNIILKKLKLKYDSSLLPTYIPMTPTYTLGKFKNLFKKRGVSFGNDIIEVPMSVIPILRLPFMWIVFRNMPLLYSKICTNLSLINTNIINLVFHSWDFINLNKLKLPFLIKNNTGKKALYLLEKYIKWCLKKNFKFNTINNYLKNV